MGLEIRQDIKREQRRIPRWLDRSVANPPIDHYVQLEICEQHLLYFALLLPGVEPQSESEFAWGAHLCVHHPHPFHFQFLFNFHSNQLLFVAGGKKPTSGN